MMSDKIYVVDLWFDDTDTDEEKKNQVIDFMRELTPSFVVLKDKDQAGKALCVVRGIFNDTTAQIEAYHKVVNGKQPFVFFDVYVLGLDGKDDVTSTTLVEAVILQQTSTEILKTAFKGTGTNPRLSLLGQIMALNSLVRQMGVTRDEVTGLMDAYDRAVSLNPDTTTLN